MARVDDDALVARVRAGDDDAFTALHDRYRRPLQAYAGRLLRGTGVEVDDVVQDVFINAHRALRARDHGDLALKPWLYRMARNRAIDELRRPGRLRDELPDGLTAPERDEPVARLGRAERMRELLSDLAELPERQRHALLRRELDGVSHAELARELDLGETATKMLVFRAREGLIKAAEARDADCQEIRVELAAAHDAGRRPTERALRHVKGCTGCAAYRAQLKALKRRMRVLDPGAGLALGSLAGVLKLLAGGGAKTAVVTAGAAAAVAGGVAVLSTERFDAGEATPVRLVGEQAYVGKTVRSGDRLPDGSSLIMKRIRLPAGPKPAQTPRVVLACPSGQRAVGLQPVEGGPRVGWGLAPDTPYGQPSLAIELERAARARPVTFTMGLLCKVPEDGRLAADPRPLRPGEAQGKVCANQARLYLQPGSGYRGVAWMGELVAVQRRSPSGDWVRVVSDTAGRGWVRAGDLCP